MSLYGYDILFLQKNVHVKFHSRLSHSHLWLIHLAIEFIARKEIPIFNEWIWRVDEEYSGSYDSIVEYILQFHGSDLIQLFN